MKAAAGALKRQHHKKESFCRRWLHRLAPYHPFTLTTQFATKQQGHHGLVAFIPALRVWLYAAVLSWMIRKSLHISAGTVQEQKSNFFPESLIFLYCFNISSYIICESLSFCVDVSLKLKELHNCFLNLWWRKKTPLLSCGEKLASINGPSRLLIDFMPLLLFDGVLITAGSRYCTCSPLRL